MSALDPTQYGPKDITFPCPECGEVMTYYSSGMTLVGFGVADDGHVHNPNCVTTMYVCKNGHRRSFHIRQRCLKPGCGWVGSETCFCHPDKKVFPEEIGNER